MKKLIIFTLFLRLFGFDIDEFDKGLDALRSDDFKGAFEIFYKGCELNDEMSCEELGVMYINGEVSSELDNVVNEQNTQQIGLNYIFKSCELGYMNACGDIVDLQKDIKIDREILNKATIKYNEMINEYQTNSDLNATN
ncbi:hypothetical protein [Campylobacter gastrosuis]|uniref:Beta-lactamase n=1 Tax=Campylobacter gastrosuis TaxID=2974576 RepID=A0ABT7HQF2_9BACT|nr:hypothetical protein [Campylobacter gastrosuis]MDL0089131.1 hypothetical protein [Campylobacter gastrosuis]